MRRQIIPAVLLTLVMAVLTGLAYPLVVMGISRVGFPNRSNGSFVTSKGKVVGSALIGQNFLDQHGNPDPRYFQPRPSASGLNGYDPTGATCPPTSTSCIASGASNLGPGDPRLVGFIPGFNAVDRNGNPSKTNPFATSDDPYCVATDKQGNPVTSPTPTQTYAKNSDGSYACDTNTVPQRALSYRQLNNLSSSTTIPVDAVTASNSGLDPDISVANTDLQAPRVASARHLSLSRVRQLIRAHTNDRQWGFLGEKTVNVLDLNLALNAMRS
jgi:potassium-transporting ATPase KdpC subunit